jgi:hypothetical protein
MHKVVAEVVVHGRRLHCHVCAHDAFWQDDVQLPTSVFAFLARDDWDHRAQCAICARCGFMHWFVAPPALARDAEDEAGPDVDPAAA